MVMEENYPHLHERQQWELLTMMRSSHLLLHKIYLTVVPTYTPRIATNSKDRDEINLYNIKLNQIMIVSNQIVLSRGVKKQESLVTEKMNRLNKS